MSTDLSTRAVSTARMTAVLGEEILAAAPREIWEWPPLGSLVDGADRWLQQVANRYEEGHASRDQVVAAAEAYRAAWSGAVETFRASMEVGAQTDLLEAGELAEVAG